MFIQNNCNELKVELEKFITIVNPQNKIKNVLIYISKKLLFFKYLITNSNFFDQYFFKCMFSDMITLIYITINLDSKRYYYLLYRSFIENYIKFILSFEENNNLSIIKTFGKFKSLCKNNNTIDEYFLIEQKYSECCNYIHSNKISNLDLIEYFKDIPYKNKISNNEINEFLNYLSYILKPIIKIIILNKNKEISEAFYLSNEKVKYLLDQDIYDIYIKSL